MGMDHYYYYSLLLQFFLFRPSLSMSPDGAALLDFKKVIFDPRGMLSSWNYEDEDPCNWIGVSCDSSSKQVVSIVLPRKNLSGSIFPSVWRLAKLKRLNLQFNNFTGPIPLELARCKHIQTLSLHHNNLMGNIPDQLGNCSLLQKLYLQNNKFSGLIPSTLGLLKNLTHLDLSYNMLTGSVPYALNNLSHLQNLNISYNHLSGAIPSNGVISKFGIDSFLGNSDLCGTMGLHSCPPIQPQSLPFSIGEAPLPLDKFSNGKPNQGTSNNLNVLLITSICVALFLVLKFSCILFSLRIWSRRNKNLEIVLGSNGKLVMFKGGASAISYKELLKGIKKIRKKHIIGEGGYGLVYKLVLKKSGTFAIKKVKQCLESIRGFEAELETLGSIKHRNLVRLHGYYISSTVSLLIYDYLPNGNLEQLLHGTTLPEDVIDWYTRHKIALGVARGLAYLHHSCDPRILHCDISASNILLDAKMEAYISDFGLAKLLEIHETHATATVAGTFGYIAPEYAEAGRVTDKCDVYSYGVLLLELMTRRRPTHMSSENDGCNLPMLARRLQGENLLTTILDETLKDLAPLEFFEAFMRLACLCVSRNPEDRPSIKNVAEYLESIEMPAKNSEPGDQA